MRSLQCFALQREIIINSVGRVIGRSARWVLTKSTSSGTINFTASKQTENILLHLLAIYRDGPWSNNSYKLYYARMQNIHIFDWKIIFDRFVCSSHATAYFLLVHCRTCAQFETILLMIWLDGNYGDIPPKCTLIHTYDLKMSDVVPRKCRHVKKQSISNQSIKRS